MKRSLHGAVIVGALVMAASTVGAQSMSPISKPVSFGIAGGASIPTGDLSHIVKTGYNISALVQFRGALWPVSLRVEGQWQQMDFKDNVPGSVKTIGGLANVLYYFPNKSLVKPYVTGGLGLVNFKQDLGSGCGLPDCSPSATKFAFDLGAGLEFRLTGMSTFVEADWQSIQTEGSAARTFPIRVGLRF